MNPTFLAITNEILDILECEEPIHRELSEDIITTRLNHQHRSITYTDTYY